MRSAYLFLCCFLFAKVSLAQVLSADENNYKAEKFVATQTETFYTLSEKFNTTSRELKKINKGLIKGNFIYPGTSFLVIVPTKPKVWSPFSATTSTQGLSTEDLLSLYDYEIDYTKLTEFAKSDFISYIQLNTDSVQYAKINKHISAIDKKIGQNNRKIDSLKKTDFGEKYDQSNQEDVLRMMKSARNKFYAQGPIGKETDSLNLLRQSLGQLANKIKVRINEVEHLNENQEYYRVNKGKEKTINSNWDNQFARISQYKKEKIQKKTPEQLISDAQKSKKNKQVELKEEPQLRKPAQKTILVMPTKEEPKIEQNSMQPVAKIEAQTPNVEESNNSTIVAEKPKPVEEKKVVIEKPKNDKVEVKVVAPVSKPIEEEKKIKVAEKPIVPKVLPAIKAEKIDIAPQNSLTENDKINVITIEKPILKKEEITKTQPENIAPQKETIAPPPVAEPIRNKVEIAAMPMLENTSLLPVFYEFSPIEKVANEDIKKKFVTNMDDFNEVKDEDLLNKYKSDTINSLAAVKVNDVSVGKVKNTPNYLIPVDTFSRIKAEFYYTKAREELEHDNLKDGEKFLAKCLEQNPNNSLAWMLHADLNVAIGNVEKAGKEYRIALEIDSTNYKAYYNLGLLYTKSNNFNLAMDYFNQALRYNDHYSKAYIARAAIFEKYKEFENAKKQYEEIISYEKNAQAYKGCGLMEVELKNFENAKIMFDEFIKLNKSDAEVFYNRGIASSALGQYPAACLDFKIASELGLRSANFAIEKLCK